MVLGVSICSEQKGKYNGPLFARKKTNYLGKVVFFMCAAALVLGVWKEARMKTFAFVSSFWKQNPKVERNLAIEHDKKNNR